MPTAIAKGNLLTRNEVARRLSLSTRTLDRWTREGRLSSVVLGSRSIRFHESEVDRLVSQSSVSPAVANNFPTPGLDETGAGAKPQRK